MVRFILRGTAMSPRRGAGHSIQRTISIGSRSCWEEEGITSVNTEKGYILLDSLAAFSTILFAALVILPLFTNIEMDRLDAKREIKAYHLLFENLERYSHAAGIADSKYVKGLACTYVTSMKPYASDPDYMEGCVSYENSKGQILSVCELVKK